jgi:signal transduction histidine kinase
MLARIEATLGHERAFIDDAAHELRTPLAVLRGELELAAHEPGDRHATARSLASALEEADRLTRLTEDLLTLARADAGQLLPGEAITELLGVAAKSQHLPHRDEVTIEVRANLRSSGGRVGEPASATLSRTPIATRRAGSWSPSAPPVVRAACGCRHGPGFPAQLLQRAFDRFSRGQDARLSTAVRALLRPSSRR